MTMEPRPAEIRVRQSSRLLEILWHDGTRSDYTFSLLRRSCRCTDCRSARLRGDAPAGDIDSVGLVNAVPVGNYALQFVFDDGHDRGIYPFAYLRELTEPERSAQA